jgi:hypothetical protein
MLQYSEQYSTKKDWMLQKLIKDIHIIISIIYPDIDYVLHI